MNRQIIVNNTYGEKRIAIIDDKRLAEVHLVRSNETSSLSNIYLGVIRRVLPGMQSAFVEFGGDRTGFIPISDFRSDITYEEFQKSLDSEADESEESQGEEASESRSEERPAAPDITSLVHEGQKIIVQVIKEPIGQKGAKMTTHISLAGRFCVLMPTISHIGVSKKIIDKEKRRELREFGQKVLAKGFGVILRTLSAEVDIKLLEKEAVSLIKRWNAIQTASKKEKAPALLSPALDPILSFVQNTKIDELQEIVVDNRNDEKIVREYFNFYGESAEDKLRFYDLPYPIFDYYSIEPEVSMLTKKKIWLKSGGFLIIEQTEALTVIDVNTGKFIGKGGNLENTVCKTNIEAAVEIAYHLRLRNIAGIIVVDFIDMRSSANKQKVYSKLESELKKDSAKCTTYYFTQLGLIQITRKRTMESNISTMSEPCPYCNGNGIIFSRDTIVFQVLREIRKQARLAGSKIITATMHPDIAFALEHSYAKELDELTTDQKITVRIETNSAFHREQFTVSDGK